MADSNVKVELNMPQILDKVQNDQFGYFLIAEWARLIQQFTPKRDGDLERNVTFRPFEMTYNMIYAGVMYRGIVYVDPIYNVGGFTNNGGEIWWSRPGVQKVPSGERFNYRTDKNPFATDHWDKAAEQAGQKEKLIQAANEYLQNKS